MYNYKVSIVIVSMNNMKELRPCLDSIKQYTSVSFELFVVAFMFSKENLAALKSEYSWVKIVESNELRGFAENNNLALRQAKGEYCFVVNDDTFIQSCVIDRLVEDIEYLPEDVAIVSPNIKFPDGRPQVCGRRKYNQWTYLYATVHLTSLFAKSKYENQEGIFQSYNITGAAFLIKTDVFRNEGWFDEYYYFCPEDIALSDSLNKKGYKCYVDSNCILYHIGGNTSSVSIVKAATIPAIAKGALYFYTKENVILKYVWASYLFLMRAVYATGYGIKALFGDKKAKILFDGSLNVCRTIFSSKTPKEIFIEIYSKKKR